MTATGAIVGVDEIRDRDAAACQVAPSGFVAAVREAEAEIWGRRRRRMVENGADERKRREETRRSE